MNRLARSVLVCVLPLAFVLASAPPAQAGTLVRHDSWAKVTELNPMPPCCWGQTVAEVRVEATWKEFWNDYYVAHGVCCPLTVTDTNYSYCYWNAVQEVVGVQQCEAIETNGYPDYADDVGHGKFNWSADVYPVMSGGVFDLYADTTGMNTDTYGKLWQGQCWWNGNTEPGWYTHCAFGLNY